MKVMLRRLTGRNVRKNALWGSVLVVTALVLLYSIDSLMGGGLWKDELAKWKESRAGKIPTVAICRRPAPRPRRADGAPLSTFSTTSAPSRPRIPAL